MKNEAHSSQAAGLVKQPIRLTVRHRDQLIMEQLFQHTPIRIGRLLDNDVVLPFDFVSRYHCELRFDDEGWVVTDLGSKNGLLTEAQVPTKQIRLEDGNTFRIQEIILQLAYVQQEELPAEDFTAIHEIQSVIDDEILEEIERTDGSLDPGVHVPLIDVDVHAVFMSPYYNVEAAREKALQVAVLWHDQLLESREFAVGRPVEFQFFGMSFSLGTVRADKTTLKIPKGARVSEGNGGAKNLVVTWREPAALQIGENVTLYFRYVPKSREIAMSREWIEEKLVDPLIVSGAIHGAAAVTFLMMAPKKHAPVVREEPERFATIIVQPTPIQVAMEPTPPPTPEPTPEPTPPPVVPTPEPPKVAKTKPPEPPKEKLKTVVSDKKRRRPALKRKEDPGGPPKALPAKLPPKEPPPVVAQTDEPPVTMETPDAPAATPQPFNAKSVGTLKMLETLSVGPASEVANVEKIQISRAPAAVAGSMIGREAVSGTGEMISKLSQSASGGGTGKGDGVAGVAVGGKSAGGQYQTAGLSGKTGNRKIRGSVLGGATYTELSKNEGLTREQVMKEVQKHHARIQQCYERALMQNPDLVGRAEFEWEISPKGDVTYVKVKEATLKNGENLLECVKQVFASMKFPAAKNGESTTPTIGLPFGRL